MVLLAVLSAVTFLYRRKQRKKKYNQASSRSDSTDHAVYFNKPELGNTQRALEVDTFEDPKELPDSQGQVRSQIPYNMAANDQPGPDRPVTQHRASDGHLTRAARAATRPVQILRTSSGPEPKSARTNMSSYTELGPLPHPSSPDLISLTLEARANERVEMVLDDGRHGSKAAVT